MRPASNDSEVRAPTDAQRSALQQRPTGRRVGRQRWNQLLFAHWVVDAEAVQATLPRGLFVDRFAGAAYLGIVPFAMERIRPAWLPPMPWLSWFLELNVRTYVHDAAGRPGVWFYSLDCNRAIAIARRFFHLPYFHARIAASWHGGTLHYECQRQEKAAPLCRYAWTPREEAACVAPGSLEFFLVERYLLFTADQDGRLYSGRVHHQPYRVYVPRVTALSPEPARQAGFHLAGEPASVLAALPVDVSIFPLTPVN
ncbi:YqjF family protein [Horticoccus sp. 23ND18S-11]|uniref:YqjF family protein n=1 Tax=Horticoccus sp. 23ND18S-11 TaxID=3391832 RepID=UPI0039C97F3F